jgi:ribosomal protein L22
MSTEDSEEIVESEDALDAEGQEETSASETSDSKVSESDVTSEPVAEEAPVAAAEEEGDEVAAEDAASKPKRVRRSRAKKKAEAEAEAEPEAEGSEDSADEAAGAEPEAKPAAAKAEPKKPVAAPRRRRSARDPSLPAPVVRAQAKHVRSSARKARLVCDNIRGKSVQDARAILAVTPRAVARDWSKVLESAIANAEHNHELVGEDLYIKAVFADEGATIKRFRPRAQGRATKIRKRTSHLTILLTPND